MATQNITTCDAPSCGRDITEGNGVGFRIMAHSETIAMRKGTQQRWNAHLGLSMKHFCGPSCLAEWAQRAAVQDEAAQKTFEAEKARAAKEVSDAEEAARLIPQ